MWRFLITSSYEKIIDDEQSYNVILCLELRKLEVEETPPVILVIKKRATIAVLCPQYRFFLYDLQMSLVNHFSVRSIKSEFGNKVKVEF